MKNIKKISMLIILLFSLFSCQEDNSTFGDLVAPSNLVIETEIVGQDAANPYGDGSGKVGHCCGEIFICLDLSDCVNRL